MENFTPLDFLSDDLFIEWQITKDEELEKYWADYAARNPQCRDAMLSAQAKLNTMRINRQAMPERERDMLLRRIRNTIDSRFRKRKIARYAAAVSAAVIAALAFFLPRPDGGAVMETSVIGHLMPSEDIQLRVGGEVMTFGDNAEIEVTETGRLSVREGEGAGTSEINVEPAVTHTLITPNGKRSTVKLPDGSKVWLNSGSELEFSSDFSRERRIRVSGEVFVEAAGDRTRPFIVAADDMTVRVYGTKFNVYAYDDDPEKSVLLVEGEVEVTHAGVSRTMEPGGFYSLHEGRAEYRTVDNPDDYYSWTRGVLSFRNASVSQILEKVGRYYNVEFRGKRMDQLSGTCSGKLILSDDIEDILKSICLISGFEFERSGDEVYMTGPKQH